MTDLSRDDLKRLAAHCAETLAKIPLLPVEVRDMTGDVLVLYTDFIVPLHATVKFLSTYLDPDYREAAERFKVLDNKPQE